METETRPIRRAVLDTVPLLLGYVPFGLVYGAAVAASSVDDVAGVAASPIVFGGASQLAAVDLLDAGAGPAVVVLTALVVNLRHVMYSGALAPWFREQPGPFQVLGPYLLVDPVYSLAIVRFPVLADARDRRRYYLTCGLLLLANWCVWSLVGVLVGNVLPEGLDLTIAVPLVFVGLLVPMVSDRPSLVAAVVGGVVTLAAQGAPLHLGLVIGAVAGVLAALAVDPEVRT